MSTIDIMVYDKLPNLALLSIVGAMLIIPPFLLPARGYDRSEESQKFILTFGTSFFFGVLVGIAVGRLSGQKPEEEFLTLSGTVAFAAGAAVCLSYWTVGHMSRQFIMSHADYLAPLPQTVGRLIATLNVMRFQTAARDIVIALLLLNTKKAEGLIEALQPRVLAEAESEDHEKSLKHLFAEALREIRESF